MSQGGRGKPYLQRSKVDDRVNLGVLLEDIVKGLLVCNVHAVEVRTLAGEHLNAVDDLGGAIGEVVDDDDFVVGLEEGDDGEGTDVAAATGAGISPLGLFQLRRRGPRWISLRGRAYPVTRQAPADMMRSLRVS